MNSLLLKLCKRNNLTSDLLQQQAASTTVYCATAPELTGITGQYFNNCFFCEPSKLSQNNEMVESLWKISEEIIERVLSDKHKEKSSEIII